MGGGNGAAKSGVAGNVELPDDNGSKDDAPGGGVGLGVVVGVVAAEGRGLCQGINENVSLMLSCGSKASRPKIS